MKRTAEKVLSWIGIVFGILGIILFAASKPLFNPDKVDTDALKSDQSPEQARQGAEHMGAMMTTGIVVSIIITILALIAVFLIKKHRIAAGVLLIIAGIIAFFSNWICTILFLIAGIMLLVRKPKNHHQDDMHRENQDSVYHEEAGKQYSGHDDHQHDGRPDFTEANEEQKEPTQFGTTKSEGNSSERTGTGFTEANSNEHQEARFGKEHTSEDMKEDLQEKGDDLHVQDPRDK
ncbi:DUF4064 domain-containing protein [Staphylococcus pettenkoferi]|uniref:DUF4064 domain-containing protein n=1 Tax=Staphylococcus pettenkoferi TaxID=170573 RepID=A0ABT4BHD2_9STAP|nr:DUF4064 domain-containing protein [Staphylococcus pettenkoferi]MCY1565187.1 DUF4064 domain-containing protein [Staphylococcus pettenkoferi]MCY1570490.1 DUF4064 domain-containing protein [Staphylococcus pettenkoferi]MCY1582083.1 DUF4064 domain-containing protein [Staphylococcus pettenkoferi]MCY1591185.1 DUF4064 domain-containing protein [Staphylococcus pettenkoferi]MCY1592741.1 DUF4064 domain-containing protein [Staphylococcus pettenkoferi]